MKESLQNIRQIICRATWLRSILVVLGVMISVSGWSVDWVGTNPIDSFYLKNIGTGYYLYVKPMQISSKWYGLTSNIDNKTKFIINQYVPNTTFFPTTFYYIQSNNRYWLGENAGNHTREGSEFVWEAAAYSVAECSGFRLTKKAGEGFFSTNKTRFLYGSDDLEIEFYKTDDNTHKNKYNTCNAVWQVENVNDNPITDFYLYNVGTGQFLTFHYDEEGNLKTYVTNNPSEASLITITKTTKTFIKFKDQDYYMYHNNGNNQEYTINDFFFTISKKSIDGIDGYQLITNTDHIRYACAGYSGYLEDRSYSQLNFPQNADNDLNSLWLFITPEEYNAKKKKLAPIHVPFTYDRFMFYDGEVTTREGEGKWDNDRVWLNAVKDTLDIHFEGIPEYLSFKYKPKISKGIPGVPPYEDRSFSVMQSPDGVLWSEPIFNNINNSSEDYLSSNSILLEPTTRYLRFCIDGCTAAASVKDNIGGCFKDIQITELHQFETDRDTVDFETHGKNDGIFEEYVAFSHANAAGNVSVSISGAEASAFVVEPATITAGKDIIHTDYVKISYIGTDVKTHNATLIFSDGIISKSVILTGQRIDKHVPIFTWNPQELPYYYDDTIPNVFSSNTSKDLAEITLDNGQTASIAELLQQTDASYSLIIHSKPQTETPCSITITQAGNDTIESITETYTFTPRQKPSLVVPFKLTKHDFDAAKTAGHFQSKDGDGNGKLLWVDSAPDSGNDKDWFNNDGEYFRLGGSGTGASVTGPTYHWEDKYIYFEFAGQPDSLFFEYIGYPLATGPDWYVFESATGEGDPMSWSKAWHVSTNTSKNFVSEYKQAAIALKSSTRFICLCYSGNYCGRYKNLYVTAYDGIYYLRNEENKYLSRGGDNGTQAVVDDYGIAVRKTRKTADNVNTYSRFQYIDQYALNKKFLGVNGEKIVSNVSGEFGNQEAVSFVESPIDGTEAIRLQHSGQSLSVGENGQLVLGEREYRWFLEKYTNHQELMQELKDAQAIMAAEEFKESVPSLAILRQQLRDNDYGKEDINLSEVYLQENPQELNQSLSTPDPLPTCSIRVKEGLYHLSLRAFNRMADNESCYLAFLQGYDNAVAYVYAKNGDKEYHTQLCSIYSTSENSPYNTSPTEGDWTDYSPRYGVYFPNGKTAAKLAFNDDNRYENDVFIYVRPDGNADNKGLLEFGLRSPSNGECMNWVCWQNFTLTRYFRKEYVFDNIENDSLWSTIGNWLDYQEKRVSREEDLPRIVHDVRIAAPIIVDVASGAAHKLTIDESVNSIVVKSDASLSIGEGGIEIEGENKNVFTLKANASGQTGVLRIYPGTPAPKATVEMFSKAYYARKQKADGTYNTNEANWQYIGTPVKDNSSACSIQDVFYQDWLYRWNVPSSGTGGWINARVEQYSPMIPFAGYTLTQMQNPSGRLYAHVGELITSDLDSIFQFRSPKGYVIANSYAAPIDLRNFKSEDFGANMQKTIYVFNTGSQKNINQASSVEDSPGQYTAMPINMTELQSKIDAGYSPFIPPMQAFVLKHIKKTDEGNSIRLCYNDLVWSAKYDKAPNAPLRAPMRGEGTDAERVNAVYMQVYSGHSLDKLYLFESDEYTYAFDNGYDAEKMIGTVALSLYAVEDTKKMSLDATPQINETYIGFHSDADSIYTFRFKYVGTPEQLYLLDQQTGKAVPMVTDTAWSFIAVPDSAYALRFRIVDESLLPIGWDVSDIQLTTSIDNATPDAYVELWQEGDNVFAACLGNHILYLYDAKGQLVATQSFVGSCVQDITELTSGIYVAKVENKVIKVVKK